MKQSFSLENKDKLREIERTIASVVIFSKDGKLLMGKKDPAKGGVYLNSWHIPGGGTEEGETLQQTAVREANQEVKGLNLTEENLVPIPFIGKGASPKVLDSGEKVWCKMEFHRFEVHLNKPAAELNVLPGDDLVELHWFTKEELPSIDQAAGGKEFFQQAGYIQ